MRKVFSVIFLVLAGCILNTATMIGFFGGAPLAVKLGLQALFMAVAAVPHCIGLALGGFRYWKRDTGIVLLSVAGATAFIGIMFACMYADDTVRRLFPPEETVIFGSIATGLVGLAITAALGGLLYKAQLNQSAVQPR